MGKHTYRGKHVTVTYDTDTCSHARECVRGLPEVFDVKQRPWVQPDKADADAVIDVVGRCPSGALAVAGGDSESATAPEAEPTNRLEIIAGGPAIFSGDLRITTRDGEVVLEGERAALCRCGASANKPFCDGSHRECDFNDPGLLSEAQSAAIEATGGVEAVLAEDGPVILRGPLEWVGSDGSTSRFESKALCRCGETGNPPFCDGTHKICGFTSDGR